MHGLQLIDKEDVNHWKFNLKGVFGAFESRDELD